MEKIYLIIMERLSIKKRIFNICLNVCVIFRAMWGIMRMFAIWRSYEKLNNDTCFCRKY